MPLKKCIYWRKCPSENIGTSSFATSLAKRRRYLATVICMTRKEQTASDRIWTRYYRMEGSRFNTVYDNFRAHLRALKQPVMNFRKKRVHMRAAGQIHFLPGAISLKGHKLNPIHVTRNMSHPNIARNIAQAQAEREARRAAEDAKRQAEKNKQAIKKKEDRDEFIRRQTAAKKKHDQLAAPRK
jgi:hypothetical protein